MADRQHVIIQSPTSEGVMAQAATKMDPYSQIQVSADTSRKSESQLRENGSRAADNPVQTFEANNLEVRSVTVYLDRAEVCRVLRSQVPAGESEVVITSLASAIDKDSIRVEVTGPATIADVAYSAWHNKAGVEAKAAGRAAAQELLRCERRCLESLRSRQARLTKQRDVLNSYADTLIRKPAASPSNTPTPTDGRGHDALVEAFDPKHLTSLNSFFDLYSRQAGRLDDELIEVRLAVQVKEEAINEMEAKLGSLDDNLTQLLSREVSIIIDSQEAAQVELRFTYVVTRAKWTPKYDIRVFSNESAMKIIYYGLVQQTTGEDWPACQLSLSTSQPGVGGAAPILGVQRAHFRANQRSKLAVADSKESRMSHRAFKTLSFHEPKGEKSSAGSSKVVPARNSVAASADHATADGGPRPLDEQKLQSTGGASDLTTNGEDTRPGVARLTHSQAPDPAATGSSVQSAQFSVPRQFSIPGDGAEHKVSIAIIDLSPKFEYESVPQKAPFAYLKATAVNTSSYPLLAGPANIYVDNNFVATSSLKAAAPMEEFSCHLGADHGIKISYKPMFKKKESGQSKLAVYMHRQAIELRNTHEKAVRVLVMEALPLSLEDKIKVTLHEPVIKHPQKYDRTKPTRINSANNVEWDVDLKPCETKEVVLRYSIECPSGKTLEYTVSES